MQAERDRRTVVVVGGGVFGLTAAIELRRRGWFVRLFDPAAPPNPAASSTDISKAVRMDYGADEFYMELAEKAISRWREWNVLFRETVYHEVGFLLLTRSPMATGGFEGDGFDLLRKRGVEAQRIERDDLRRRFRAWNADAYMDGYFNPQAGWTPSGRVISLLAGRARAAGVRIHGARVLELRGTDSRVSGVATEGGATFSADFVLVAAGAWTPAIVHEMSGLMWATGHPVLHFAPTEPEIFRPECFPVWGADISHTGWYGFPVTASGVLKVANHGPGRRVAPSEPLSVSERDVERCREFFLGSFHGLSDAPLVGSRLCLYCDTSDGDFWIDHHPRREGLIVAAGGSGHGFKFAPVLGEIIADVVEGRPNRWAGRFRWRSRREGGADGARHRG
jgi:glycine/D-amino acid oxidase-like deaminating enzyme